MGTGVNISFVTGKRAATWTAAVVSGAGTPLRSTAAINPADTRADNAIMLLLMMIIDPLPGPWLGRSRYGETVALRSFSTFTRVGKMVSCPAGLLRGARTDETMAGRQPAIVSSPARRRNKAMATRGMWA